MELGASARRLYGRPPRGVNTGRRSGAQSGLIRRAGIAYSGRRSRLNLHFQGEKRLIS
jgi:hypothetical protein